LDALLSTWVDGGTGAVLGASAASAALPDPRACFDARHDGRRLPLDPSLRAAVRRSYDDLARADALMASGRVRESHRVLLAIAARTDAMAFARLKVDVHSRSSRSYEKLGDIGAAVESQRRAADVAGRSGFERSAATGWTNLVWLEGYGLGRYEAAHEHAARAGAWIERIGGDPELEAALLRSQGWLHLKTDNLGEAEASFQHSRRVLEGPGAALEDQSEQLAITLNGLASVQTARGRYEAALESFAAAHDAMRVRLGADHPETVVVRLNEAVVLRSLGRLEASRQRLADGLRTLSANLGPEHPRVGEAALNLAVVSTDLGHHEQGLAYAEQALGIFERVLGPEHPNVAKAIVTRGRSRLADGRPREARRDFRAAMVLALEVLGDEHPETAEAEHELGRALAALGRPRQALERQRNALHVLEAAWGPEHPDLARILLELARRHRELGDLERARALAVRAEAIAPQLETPAVERLLQDLRTTP